jgi:hypothetical protein
MTFTEKNTLARTGFLGLLTCVLVVLVFQAYGVLKESRQDEHALAVQSSELLKTAKGFIPAQPLDVARFYAIADSAVALLKEGKTTVQLLHAPCVPGPCGLFGDAAKTLNTARLMMGQVETAANHEDKNLGTLDQQETTIYADSHDDLQALHALLASPDLLSTMHNLDATSASVADSAKQADGTIADIHDEVHSFTHPAKKKGFVAGFEATGDVMKHWIPSLF